MSKVLLVPGSFNPVTNAHIDMALAAKKAVNADIVYFIPAHDRYVAQKKIIMPGSDRVALLNAVPKCRRNGMLALDIEVNSSSPTKTYDTVIALQKSDEARHIENEYYLCFGMDNIKTLRTWYRWQDLIKEYRFVACVREGQTLETALEESDLTEYNDRFTEIQIPENHVSSSLVRELSASGQFEAIRDMVPENVYEYLINYYKENKGENTYV